MKKLATVLIIATYLMGCSYAGEVLSRVNIQSKTGTIKCVTSLVDNHIHLVTFTDGDSITSYSITKLGFEKNKKYFISYSLQKVSFTDANGEMVTNEYNIIIEANEIE